MSVEQVAAFLDREHLDGYRIVNVMPDMLYNTETFRGRVDHVPVPDGATPALATLVAAAQYAVAGRTSRRARPTACGVLTRYAGVVARVRVAPQGHGPLAA